MIIMITLSLSYSLHIYDNYTDQWCHQDFDLRGTAVDSLHLN